MKTATGKSPRTRAKIIAELASLPSAIQGKICEDKKRLANGATAVYHNLQYWANGRNHTVRIPDGRAKTREVKAAAIFRASTASHRAAPFGEDADASEQDAHVGRAFVLHTIRRLVCIMPQW